MRRRRLLLIVGAVVAVAAGVAAATVATLNEATPDPACPDRRWGCAEFEPDEPIVIGALLPTSGPAAPLGDPALEAVREPVEEADPILGHDVVLDAQDDACRQDLASEAARRFATSRSPTRPPTAAVVGAICRPTVEPAAQILSDSGVPLVTWFDDDLRFGAPSAGLPFLVRIEAPQEGPSGPEAAARVAASLVIDAIRDVAVRLDDGTVLVPRTHLRDALRAVAGDRA